MMDDWLWQFMAYPSALNFSRSLPQYSSASLRRLAPRTHQRPESSSFCMIQMVFERGSKFDHKINNKLSIFALHHCRMIQRGLHPGCARCQKSNTGQTLWNNKYLLRIYLSICLSVCLSNTHHYISKYHKAMTLQKVQRQHRDHQLLTPKSPLRPVEHHGSGPQP